MFEITLIAMGKLKEKFYLSAAAEYEKRMKGYCQFRLLELPEVRLPENPSAAEISAGLEKEAELIIRGKEKLTGGTVSSYNDHRIAMAAAVAATLCQEPVTITNAEAVNKSYPKFWEHLELLGGKIRRD